MERTSWKILAIVMIVIVVAETGLIGFFYYIGNQEIEKQNMCYYDICSGSADALYEDNVCFCYDYDVLGQLAISKTYYMK